MRMRYKNHDNDARDARGQTTSIRAIFPSSPGDGDAGEPHLARVAIALQRRGFARAVRGVTAGDLGDFPPLDFASVTAPRVVLIARGGIVKRASSSDDQPVRFGGDGLLALERE